MCGRAVGGAAKVEGLNVGARLEDGPYSETQMGIPEYWFAGDEAAGIGSKEQFEKLFATIIPKQSRGHQETRLTMQRNCGNN